MVFRAPAAGPTWNSTTGGLIPSASRANRREPGWKRRRSSAKAIIKGIRIVLGLTDSGFIMGSMGSVVGEKLTRAIEEATRQQLPLVIVSGIGRRGQNARGDFLTHADGEGFNRPGAISRGWRAVCQRADSPDDGRASRPASRLWVTSSWPSPRP